MSTPRNVCHRCRTKWKVKRGENSRECPKCGCTNVGPTDPARGNMGLIVVVLLLAVGGAWYFDLLPGEAKEALEDARDAVETNIEDVRREVGGDDSDERPRPTPTKKAPKSRAPKKEATKTKATKPAPRPTPKAESDAPPLPVPDVVVSSKSGVLIGSAYLVKGKVKNTGGAEASRVRVVVTFLGTGGALTEVEAACPSTLAAGKTARYEAAVTGDTAQAVDSFTVKATFE